MPERWRLPAAAAAVFVLAAAVHAWLEFRLPQMLMADGYTHMKMAWLYWTGELPLFGGDLPTLAALLRRAALVVSGSTGPVHLASALRTPTLAIQAPWAACGVTRWGPYSDNGWGLVAEHPRAPGWSRRERARHGAALMAAVSPEVVLTHVRRISRARAETVDVGSGAARARDRR